MGKMNDLSLLITELKKCGETLISISESLSDLFSGTGESLDTEKPEKDNATAPKEKTLTLEEVRAVLADKSRNGYTTEVRALLEKYGATKLSQINPAQYPAVLAEAEVLGNG